MLEDPKGSLERETVTVVNNAVAVSVIKGYNYNLVTSAADSSAVQQSCSNEIGSSMLIDQQ